MSENKSLDGIKKLSKDEIKKARKILLDYIGEDADKNTSASSAQERKEKTKNVDGILGGINFKKRSKREKKEKENLENIKKEREVLKKELGFSDKKKEIKEEADKNIGGAFLRMAEKSEKKKNRDKTRKDVVIRNKEAELEEERKRRVKKELEERRKLILEEAGRKNKEAKKTAKIKEELEKEKRHLAKVKKEEDEKRKVKKVEEEIAAKKKKEKDKKEKRKRIKKKYKLYKHRIHKKTIDSWNEIKQRKKKIVISISILIVCSLLLYLFFVLLLIKFNPNNKITRIIANYMPVPALVSSVGVVEYYDYIDKRNIFRTEFEVINDSVLNKIFALDFVLNDLVKRYGINHNDVDFRQKVEKNIMLDLQVNSVGIKRIGKIKDLIDDGGNFVQVSNKYGDQVDKIDFDNEQLAVEKFGDKLFSLRIDQVSDIVAHDDGYYIFKRYKKNNMFSLSYVYIASVSLDEYLNEEAANLKIWSLVD